MPLFYTNPTLPNWIGKLPEPEVINKNATTPDQYQATTSGENDGIPIVYGEVRIGIKIAAAKVHSNGYLYIIGVLCEGPVNSISSYEVDNKPLNATTTPALGTDITIVSFTGSSTQTAYTSTPIVGATMLEVFGAGFADAMQNTAYLIMAIKPNTVQSVPQITALVQGRLVYDPRQNLTKHSESPTSWPSKTNIAVSTTSYTDSKGFLTAYKVTESNTTAAAYHDIGGSAVAVTSGGVYVASIEVKAGERDKIQFGWYLHYPWGFQYPAVDVNLATPSITAMTTATKDPVITALSDGWYKVQFSATCTVDGSMGVYFRLRDASGNYTYTGVVGNGAYISRAQVREAGRSSGYVKTTSSIFDQLTVSTRQNLILRSEQLGNAAWGTNGATVSSDVYVAPDGSTSAELVTNAGALAVSLIGQTPNIESSNDYIVGIYVKQPTSSPAASCTLNCYLGGTAPVEHNITFDFATKVITETGAGVSLLKPWYEVAGNGWYKICHDVPANPTETDVMGFRLWPSGRGATSATGTVFWGAQISTKPTYTTYTALSTETFSSSTWTKTGCVITANSISGPTSILYDSARPTSAKGYADLLNITSGTNSMTANPVFGDTSTVTISAYVKKLASNYFRIEVGNTINGWFDILNGTTGTNTGSAATVQYKSKSIESIGNGWYKCTLVVNTSEIFTTPVTLRFCATNGAASINGDSGYLYESKIDYFVRKVPYVTTVASVVNPTAATEVGVYSKNPAVCLGDFISSTSYGAGKISDPITLGLAAEANDQSVGNTVYSETAREIGLVLNNVATTQSWIETLRTYAATFVNINGNTAYFTPDIATSAVAATYTPDTIVEGSLSIKKEGLLNTPNYVEVQFTDTTTTPWKTSVATATGDLSRGKRASSLSLPGILRYTQANREAIERLNGFTLCDLQTSFTVFDEGLNSVIGDIITVKHKYFDIFYNCLELDGATNSYAYTADSVNASVTRDIELKAEVAFTNYQGSNTLVAKWTDGGVGRGYVWYITAGNMHFHISTTGSDNLTVNVALPATLVNGTKYWFKVNRTYSNGFTNFYYSTDNQQSWIQIGAANQVISAGSQIYDNLSPLTIGAYNTGTALPATGKFYKAEVRSGVGGTLKASFDADLGFLGVSTVTASTTEAWAISGTARIWKDYAAATGKNFRIQGINKTELGRWQITAFEYNALQYSNSVETNASSIPDTNNGIYLAIPAGNIPTLTEQVIRSSNGEYSSRIQCSWTAPYVVGSSSSTYPLIAGYYIKVTHIGGAYYDTAGVKQTVSTPIDLVTSYVPFGQLTYTTPDLPGTNVENDVTTIQQFAVAIAIQTTSNLVGSFGTAANISLTKKLSPPSDVSGLTVYEVGGECRISWTAATDLDLKGYWLRYGTVGAGWAGATDLNKLDALRFVTKDVAPGTWDFYIKAFDSVGNTSTGTGTAANVIVTEDSAAFNLDTRSFGVEITPTLTNMVEFGLGRSDTSRRYVTDDGVVFGTRYSSTLGAYTAGALASYHSAVTSTWVPASGDYLELGSDLSATWNATSNVYGVSGTSVPTVASSLQVALSATPTSFTSFGVGVPIKTTGRYGRIQHQTLQTMLVICPNNSLAISAVPREESGAVTTNTATSTATVVQLSNAYISAEEIGISPQGTNDAVIAKWDNVLVNPYSVTDFLDFTATRTSTASTAEAYAQIATALTYQIQSGDYIQYDCYVIPPAEGYAENFFYAQGGLILSMYSASVGGTLVGNLGGELDQNFVPLGLGDTHLYSKRQWYSRKAAIPAFYAGKFLRHCEINCINASTGHEATLPLGTYRAFFRNIRITDVNNVLKSGGTIYSSGNPLTNNVTQTGATASAVTVKGNRFDIHVTNDTGSTYLNNKQVYWRFKGI